MNNKKIILAILICIPALFLMISTVSAGDLEYGDDDGKCQLDIHNTAEVYDYQSGKDTTIHLDFDKGTPIKKEKDGSYSTTIKSSKNKITVKKTTKKVKTVKFTYSQSKTKCIKQLKKIKNGNGGKYALSGPYGYSNIKVCKLLKENKIKSYKFQKKYHKSYKYTEDGAIITKHPIYKVTVKYYVCKKVKKYTPVHVYIHMNWKKFDSGSKTNIGYLCFDGKFGFSDDYYFDSISPQMLSKLKP